MSTLRNILGLLLVAAVALTLQAVASGGPSTAAAQVSATPVGPEAVRLTNRFGKRFLTHQTDHFAVVYTSDTTWAREAGTLLEGTRTKFYDSLRQAGFSLGQSREPLVWICFNSRDDFSDYAREVDRVDMSWLEGYYSARTNRVALTPRHDPRDRQAGVTRQATRKNFAPLDSTDVSASVDTPVRSATIIDVRRAIHEAGHQLAFNSGLQKRGVMYPFWVSEGLATNFEADSLEALEFGGDNPSRRRQLRRVTSGDRLIDLEEFVGFTRLVPGNGHEPRDVYAQAWGLFNFLYNYRPAQLRQYLAALARLEPGRRSERTLRAEFEAAFGPIESIELAWRRYLQGLDRPPVLASQVRR